MPQIPENKHRPNLKCTIIDLLESIAMEEMALSHLLNAEAEKIQAFVGEKLDFPYCSNIKGLLTFSRTSSDFMDKIIMKEWLLMNKLNKVMEISDYSFTHTNASQDTNYKDCVDCTRPLKKFCNSDE